MEAQNGMPDLRTAIPEMVRLTRRARWKPAGFVAALAYGVKLGLGFSRELPQLRRSYARTLVVVGLLIALKLGILAYIVPIQAVVVPVVATSLWFVVGSVIVLALLSLVRFDDGTPADSFGFSNALTLYRFMSIPLLAALMPLFPHHRGALALGTVAFVLAAVTDVADGNYARVTHTVTDFGRIYDPICDICINAAVCIGAWGAGYFPGWYTLLALARFFLPILGGAMVYASGRPWKVRPTLLGKLTVFVYVLFVGLTLLKELSGASFLVSLTDRFLMLSGLLFAFNVVYIFDRGLAMMRQDRTEQG